MNLTGKQAHVLANLDRVERTHPKVRVQAPRMRFELDGWDCTTQVTSLVVKKKVQRYPGGSLARLQGEQGSA